VYKDEEALLLNRAIEKVEINEDKTALRFHFKEGEPCVLYVSGDCCSESWIEHLAMPYSYRLNTVENLKAVDVTCVDIGEVVPTRQEVDLLYSITVKFDTGSEMIIEMRNSSNGYYGGDFGICQVNRWEKDSFKPLTESF